MDTDKKQKKGFCNEDAEHAFKQSVFICVHLWIKVFSGELPANSLPG